MNSFTVDQCVEKINARLEKDGLMGTMNVRLLRHYQQQKSMPSPTQEGRFAKYTDEHVEAVIALRKAQTIGVSSKAYATLSNIEKHSDPYATIASLKLNTPTWMANSTVGDVALASPSSNTSNLFGSSLSTTLMTTNRTIKPSLTKIPTLHELMSDTPFQVPVDVIKPDAIPKPSDESVKDAAIRALHELRAGPDTNALRRSAASGSAMTQKRSTLSRVIGAIHPAKNIAPMHTTSGPNTAHERTEWTLHADVRVQIPTQTLAFLSKKQVQAFEAWMAQMPGL